MAVRWVPVPGWPFYEVSDTGLIRRVAREHGTWPGRILKPPTCTVGYKVVRLHNGDRALTRYVHSIVAEAFIGPRPMGFEINHKDADKLNNNRRNLEYVTRKQNAGHAQKLGRYRRGEDQHSAKMTELDVRAMRALRTCGWSQRKLAKTFGLSQHTVVCAISRKTWKHV
jgi:hypothetical protein